MRKTAKKPLVKNISRKRRIQFNQHIGQDDVPVQMPQRTLFEETESRADSDIHYRKQFQLI